MAEPVPASEPPDDVTRIVGQVAPLTFMASTIERTLAGMSWQTLTPKLLAEAITMNLFDQGFRVIPPEA